MSYSTDRALQLAEVLKRFATLNAYASFMLELHELEASAERLGTGFEPYELEREAPV